MIRLHKISWKNFLSTGNTFTTIELDTHRHTLIVGKNGDGKCLHRSTEVEIEFSDKEVEKKFKQYLKTRHE